MKFFDFERQTCNLLCDSKESIETYKIPSFYICFSDAAVSRRIAKIYCERKKYNKINDINNAIVCDWSIALTNYSYRFRYD